MSTKEKMYARLDSLETEFRHKLAAALPRVAEGHDTLFFLTERSLHQWGFPRHYLRPETLELEKLGREIEKLRKTLGEPLDESIYGRFRSYCDKWADEKDHYRLGDAKLASQFLAEISKGGR